jgi:hypothetical protein
MTFFSNDITDSYLEKLSDDFQKELQRILQDIKTDSDNGADKLKQVPLLNSILINTTKLLKLRKKIRQRIDG